MGLATNNSSFTRVSLTSKNDRVKEKDFDMFLYKDYRFIINKQKWTDKIVDSPVEIECPSDGEIYISNCEFNKGLTIRVGFDTEIKSIFIFCSEFSGGLHLHGSEHYCNSVKNNIDIDSCVVDKFSLVQLAPDTVHIYSTNIDEIIIESNNFQRFIVEKSNIGLLLEHSNVIDDIDIKSGSFEKYKIIPNKIFKVLQDRYQSIELARDTSLRTIDFLIKNKNVIFPSNETSCLYYERNRIQTKSSFSKILLWFLGYFQSLARYFVTALILYTFIVLLLGVTSLYEGSYIAIPQILRLALNSFIGLSYTLEGSNHNYFSSIIMSISIGLGTIFYSGILVTVINRFRVKF